MERSIEIVITIKYSCSTLPCFARQEDQGTLSLDSCQPLSNNGISLTF